MDTTAHTAPCGATFDTAADAESHRVTCGECAGTEDQRDVIPTEGPHAGLIDMDRVAELLRDVHGIEAAAHHSGGGCATIYAGAVTRDAEDVDRYQAVAGPGTYMHRDYGKSTAWLHEFNVGADYDDAEFVEAHETGVKTLRDVAALIAAQVQSSPHLPGADALEAAGLDPSLRSTPAWLAEDMAHIREQVAEANEANRARIAQAVAARSYSQPEAGTYVREPWEV